MKNNSIQRNSCAYYAIPLSDLKYESNHSFRSYRYNNTVEEFSFDEIQTLINLNATFEKNIFRG